MPLQRTGQTLCSTNVTTSPRVTANQRQPVIVPGQAAPVFVGQFGMRNLPVSFHLMPAVFSLWSYDVQFQFPAVEYK